MERLHQILHNLDHLQVKVLKSYLTGFSTRNTNTKFWNLAALLLADKNNIPTLKACSLAVYDSFPDGRIEKLKNRLYTKVLDSLLIDINTNRDIYEEETYSIQVRLRKKMIIYDLVKFTPLKSTVGMVMIKEIISTAKKYEFHSILLDAMYINKNNNGIRKGLQVFKKMNAEIAFYEKAKQHAQRALDLYMELAMYSTFDTKANRNKLEEFLKKSIAELRTNYLDTKVKSVGHYLKTFEMTFHQLNKNIQGARDIAVSVLENLKKDKTFGRKGRFGIWYGYLAHFELEMGNYDAALKYLNISRKYFPEGSLNSSINRGLEADAMFLKGDYQKAKEIAVSLSNEDSKVTGDFRRDIMLYYKACCHFMLGEYREAARLFNIKFQLSSDKLGWEMNIRIMRILINLELGHIDEAHAMVEAHTKHVKRYQHTKDLSIRDRMVLKLFQELAKEGFAFDRPNDKVYHFLLQLREKGKPHSWEVLSPELIPIHNWVMKKYKHFLPPSSGKRKIEKVYKTAARKKTDII